MKPVKVGYEILQPELLDKVLPFSQAQILKMRCGIKPYERKHSLKEISDMLDPRRPSLAKNIEGRAIRALQAHKIRGIIKLH